MTVEEPAQIVASPETWAFGAFSTVTTALPDTVPGPFASETAVTVYVVDDDGETLRVAGPAERLACVTPSDHPTTHGGVPASAACMVADPPAQIVPPPDTVAVAGGVSLKTTPPPSGPPETVVP